MERQVSHPVTEETGHGFTSRLSDLKERLPEVHMPEVSMPSKKTATIAGLAALGLAIAGTVAYLFATDDGAKTRKEIAKQGKKVYKRARHLTSSALDSVEELEKEYPHLVNMIDKAIPGGSKTRKLARLFG